MSEDEDINQVVEDVNEMAGELRDEPGVVEQGVVPLVKTVTMLLPVSLAAVTVAIDVFTGFSIPVFGQDPQIAYTAIMLIGLALTYLLHRTMSEERDYKPGPGERIDLD